jgi:hypothetical protein
MKLRRITFPGLLGIVMVMTAVIGFSAEEKGITKQEEREAQQFAQRFVKRLQETRDVTPIIDEMFLPDFISHFVSGDETVSPSLYSLLMPAERQRLFIAQTNAGYLATLDVICKPERKMSEEEKYKSAFESILPSATAEKLRNAAWPNNQFAFSSYEDFQSRLPEIEKALSEARTYLISHLIEQTPEFQSKLDDTVKGTGMNYRVRAYIGGDEIKDSESLVGFPANQKFFRVETPLQMGVILIRDDNQMKVVRVTGVDED